MKAIKSVLHTTGDLFATTGVTPSWPSVRMQVVGNTKSAGRCLKLQLQLPGNALMSMTACWPVWLLMITSMPNRETPSASRNDLDNSLMTSSLGGWDTPSTFSLWVGRTLKRALGTRLLKVRNPQKHDDIFKGITRHLIQWRFGRTEVRSEDDSGLETLWLLKKMAFLSGTETKWKRWSRTLKSFGCTIRSPQKWPPVSFPNHSSYLDGKCVPTVLNNWWKIELNYRGWIFTEKYLGYEMLGEKMLSHWDQFLIQPTYIFSSCMRNGNFSIFKPFGDWR